MKTEHPNWIKSRQIAIKFYSIEFYSNCIKEEFRLVYTFPYQILWELVYDKLYLFGNGRTVWFGVRNVQWDVAIDLRKTIRGNHEMV